MGHRSDNDWHSGFESLEPRVLFNGDASTISILPLGDSITASSGSLLSYRYYLWENLLDAGIDFDLVGTQDTNRGSTPNWPDHLGQSFDRDHEGHSGQRVDQINDVLAGYLNSYTPDIALVHLGTNDIIQGQSASSTANELRTTIDRLRQDNPDVTIFLAQIIPLDHANGSEVDVFNALLPGIASDLSTNQSQVIVVDLNSGFDVDDDTYDGIHPDRSGEELMALRFYQALDNFLDCPPDHNIGPVADAGPNQSLVDSNENGTVTFRLDGRSSSDSDGTISSYIWRINGSTVATGDHPSLSLAIGTHTVELTVTDNDGDSATDTVTLNATAPSTPSNTAPTVNAGPDRTSVTSNGRVTLAGTASDADGDSITTQWSVVSADGSVTFADATDPSSQATLDGEGEYVLKLTVDDGQSSRSDNVTITIVSPSTSPPGGGGGSNTAPTVSAGPDRVSFTSNGRVSLSGSASDADGDSITTRWSVVSAPGNVTFADADDPTTQATLSGDGVFILRLTASDGETSRSSNVEISINPTDPPPGGGSNFAPTVDAGPDRVSITSNGRVTLAGSASDADGDTLTTQWSVVSAPGNVTFSDASDPTTQVTLSGDGIFVLRLTVSDGTETRTDDVEISINPTSPPPGGGGGSNTAPTVNAGPDRISFTSNGRVSLSGSASDADGDNITAQWSVVSAPGNVTFADASDPTTQATLSGDGIFVLRLTVSDGTETRTDDVEISINPTTGGGGSNIAPQVNAGPDRVSVTSNGRVTLAGSASDADGDNITIFWSVISAPGNVTFVDSDDPTTQATLHSEGVYILRLTASDGQFTSTSDVSITIQRPA